MRNWSYSRLSTVEQCGLKFWRRYVLGERGGGSEATQKGSLVHEVLEAVLGEAIKRRYRGPLNKAKILKHYKRLWAKFFPEGGSLEAFADGEQMLTSWIDRVGSVDFERLEAVEQRFSIGLENGDRLIGFIDLIERNEDGSITIVDYKTSRWMHSTSDLDHSMQLGIYALAARRLWPGQDVKLCFDMLRHGERQYTSRTAEQLDTLEAYITALIERVDGWELAADAAGAYPPAINSFCGWCDFQQLCPAYTAALDKGDVEDITPSGWDGIAEHRERMAEIETIAKAKRTEADRLIRDNCKETGQPLYASGRVYTLAQRPAGRSYPLDQVVELIETKSGHAVADIAKGISAVTNDKLRRYIARLDLSDSERIRLEFDCERVSKMKTRTIVDARGDR